MHPTVRSAVSVVVCGLLVAGCGGVTSGAAAHRPTLSSKREQEKVLDSAYARMLDHYPKRLETPGPRDVVDYGIGKLWSQGIDGAGSTIALIEAWGEPSIGRYVADFDKNLGLPNAQITTIFPSGRHKLPAQCPPAMVKLGGYADCQGSTGELVLDVDSAHLIAPYAKIVIAVAPPDSEITEDAASQVAPPEMMQAVEAISRHHLANVVSISVGTGEASYSHGRDEVTAQDPGELTAAAAGIPVVAATGDCGAAMATPRGHCEKTPQTGAWDDSPWTLAVGGSLPNLSKTGKRLGSDSLWHHEGAGLSSIFARPSYQSKVESTAHRRMRSVPDITMDADAGTSEAAPLMAGVLALATQANGGHDLGPINPALYDVLGPKGAADGIADVVHGNNSITQGGKVLVPGFAARSGFDIASGWGTIDAPRFVPALVEATRALHEERAARARASTDLAALRRAVQLSPARVAGAATSHLRATGFLPNFPVVLSIGSRRVARLHADNFGNVAYTLHPGRLHLTAGTHTVTLTSMLITLAARLTTR